MGKAQQTQKKIKKDVENKYYVWILFAVFLITLTIFCTYKIIDDDVFWHLATGKFIIENKYVPDKDVFGFATQNTEWIPFEWGWDVVSYGIHSIGGGADRIGDFPFGNLPYNVFTLFFSLKAF